MKGRVRGFTIIELLVVIAVIGIIAVAVNTDFLDFPVARSHYTARKIQSDIRYTQQLAMALQLRTRITFNTTPTNTYAVEYENPSSTWNAALDPISRQSFTVTLNSGDFQGVTINGIAWDPANSGNKIIFNEIGSPFDQNGTALAGNATIELNASRNLVMTPNTGKVEIA